MSHATELHELRQTARPQFEAGSASLSLVDLFAGCGGLTLGAAQAAFAQGVGTDIRLAVDLEASATAVYSTNFKKAVVETASIDSFFDGELGAELTPLEKRTKDRVGDLHLLMGGPPCQGHSDLNNRTRRDDPKNALYARMARAAEVLRPRFVMIENVPTVLHDISRVVETTRAQLEIARYAVAGATLSLHSLGVAQRRKRHILLASRIEGSDPTQVLSAMTQEPADPGKNLRWAIGDLEKIENPSWYDEPPRASADNLRRMQYLLDHDLYDLPNRERPECHRGKHSYKSMYGRLNWERPAQTITSGFGSIGQGRYMHPSNTRALTPHEAARLQDFPDYFDFSLATRRADLATMIGNAVPPALARGIVARLIPHMVSTAE